MSSRTEVRKRTATSGPESKSRAGKSSKRDIRFCDLVEPALQAKRELKKNEESSIETDRFRLRRVLPIIGHVKIGQLTPGRIERFLQELSRGDATHRRLSGASLNRYHSLLSSIFRYAVRQGVTRVNPLAAGGVERAKEAKIHIRFLNDAEQHRLSVAIRKQCPEKLLEVELAILTGMRRGEQFNARWDDWKVREGVLCVTGKTGPRTVRINRKARLCLTRLRARARKGSIFITPERNESPVDRRLWFEKAVKKAELRAFRWHDMRHTFCSRLVAAGVPLLEVQKLAGHESFSTTLRYSHLAPDQLRRAVEKVEF